jgi:hypothetical protein
VMSWGIVEVFMGRSFFLHKYLLWRLSYPEKRAAEINKANSVDLLWQVFRA